MGGGNLEGSVGGGGANSITREAEIFL